MQRVVTIGVYDWDLDGFLAALRAADVALLIDVRQRRGVRGREYAWANAVRLQNALASAGIAYRHVKELAPTTELRHLLYAEDARRAEGKRSRTVLAPVFRERYAQQILNRVDLADLVAQMPEAGATALLCVEHDPEACHRSLIAGRLAGEPRLMVGHIT